MRGRRSREPWALMALAAIAVAMSNVFFPSSTPPRGAPTPTPTPAPTPTPIPAPTPTPTPAPPPSKFSAGQLIWRIDRANPNILLVHGIFNQFYRLEVWSGPALGQIWNHSPSVIDPYYELYYGPTSEYLAIGSVSL